MSVFPSGYSRARFMPAVNYQLAQRFLKHVVDPAFLSVKEELASFKADTTSGNARTVMLGALGRVVTEQMLTDMSVAFCLSIQASWERGFRGYVGAFAQDLPDPKAEADSKALPWPTVTAAFNRLHGVVVNDLPGFDELDLLNKLGNVCRHGPGSTMDKLQLSHPQFWPAGVNRGYHPSLAGFVLEQQKLHDFARSIESFWRAIEQMWPAAPLPSEEDLARMEAEVEKALLDGTAIFGKSY